MSNDDNPVAINVTAMVDVIFCLCLFFMCSMHFKQLEGKIDAWLPKDPGLRPDQAQPVELEEVRVVLRWDEARKITTRLVGNVAVTSDKDLIDRVMSMVADYRRAGHATPPVVIDGLADVPWKDVIAAMDLCKSRGLERINLTQPIETR